MYGEQNVPTLAPLLPLASLGAPPFSAPLTSYGAMPSLPVLQTSFSVSPAVARPVPGDFGHNGRSPTPHSISKVNSLRVPGDSVAGPPTSNGAAIDLVHNSPEAGSASSTGSSVSPVGEGSGYDSVSNSSNEEPLHSSQKPDPGKGKDRKRKGVPYIPSYMDLSNGPEPCVVCGDAATGYHYRCMTCEGCKGFFRRTIQKNLQYHCKWNKSCIIDKTTRNQCQECRFIKCLNVGMATDLVLNERQRTAKRRLIEENRERRKEETVKTRGKDSIADMDTFTDQDRGLICEVVTAYEYTAGKVQNNKGENELVSKEIQTQDPESWQQLAEAMTPSIVKVIEFAKGVPGFTELNVDDQILLLKSCCMEVMCLRAACRFDPEAETLFLHNGMKLHKSQIHSGGVAVLIEPIFDFAMGLSKLKLDKAEIALLAAILLMQSDRSGLKEPENVEKIQDAILGAFKRYVSENRPHQPVHWAKILMKVTDLRTISTRHAERVLCIRLDHSGEIPPLLLEVFNEGHAPSSS